MSIIEGAGRTGLGELMRRVQGDGLRKTARAIQGKEEESQLLEWAASNVNSGLHVRRRVFESIESWNGVSRL